MITAADVTATLANARSDTAIKDPQPTLEKKLSARNITFRLDDLEQGPVASSTPSGARTGPSRKATNRPPGKKKSLWPEAQIEDFEFDDTTGQDEQPGQGAPVQEFIYVNAEGDDVERMPVEDEEDVPGGDGAVDGGGGAEPQGEDTADTLDGGDGAGEARVDDSPGGDAAEEDRADAGQDENRDRGGGDEGGGDENRDGGEGDEGAGQDGGGGDGEEGQQRRTGGRPRYQGGGRGSRKAWLAKSRALSESAGLNLRQTQAFTAAGGERAPDRAIASVLVGSYTDHDATTCAAAANAMMTVFDAANEERRRREQERQEQEQEQEDQPARREHRGVRELRRQLEDQREMLERTATEANDAAQEIPELSREEYSPHVAGYITFSQSARGGKVAHYHLHDYCLDHSKKERPGKEKYRCREQQKYKCKARMTIKIPEGHGGQPLAEKDYLEESSPHSHSPDLNRDTKNYLNYRLKKKAVEDFHAHPATVVSQTVHQAPPEVTDEMSSDKAMKRLIQKARKGARPEDPPTPRGLNFEWRIKDRPYVLFEFNKGTTERISVFGSDYSGLMLRADCVRRTKQMESLEVSKRP